MLDSLYSRKHQFEELSNKVSTVLSQIKDSSVSLTNVNSSVKENYTIDGVSADSNQIQKCLDVLESKESALSSVLSNISSEIAELNRRIREEEERLERERQERLAAGL